MNTASAARIFFSLMVAVVLVGFTVSAQEKAKEEMKTEKVEVKGHRHHAKAMKAKAEKMEKEKKTKKDAPQPK